MHERADVREVVRYADAAGEEEEGAVGGEGGRGAVGAGDVSRHTERGRGSEGTVV